MGGQPAKPRMNSKGWSAWHTPERGSSAAQTFTHRAWCRGVDLRSLPAAARRGCRLSRGVPTKFAHDREPPLQPDPADECVKLSQASYLKESDTRVRNAATLPSSTFMSICVTSATRRSRSDPAAVSTALRPASSHDLSLTPTTSTIL